MIHIANWLQMMDTGKEVCAVFFDLHKVFDSVPHQSLLEKLPSSGIDSHTLKWLFSYLHNREQYVILNGKQLSHNRITSDVPQGSVLGPLLFLIYINDSAGEMLNTGSFVTMYADDLLLHRVINSSEDYELLQNDVTDHTCQVVGQKSLNSKCKQM